MSILKWSLKESALNSLLTITSKGMSFTSLKAGGLYKHNHAYAIHYGEYFGSINNINLEDSTATGSVTWKEPEKTTGIYMTHTASQSSAYGLVDGYSTYGSTRLTNDLSIPYISVYFWRRTA